MDSIIISVGFNLFLILFGAYQGFLRIRKVELKIPTDTVGNETIDSKLQSQRDSLQQEFGVIRVQLEGQIKALSTQNIEQATKIKALEDNDKSKDKKINDLNERIVNLTEALDNEKSARIEAEKRATIAEKEKTELATKASADKAEWTTEIKVLSAKLEILEKVIQNPAPIRFVIDTSMLVNGDKKATVESGEKGVE